MDFAVAVAP